LHFPRLHHIDIDATALPCRRWQSGMANAEI
jgi:hypothetical protein